MFNIGGGEVFVIFLLALIVLGPERLPKAMGQLGRAVGQLRQMSAGFQDEIRRAMDPVDAPFRPGEERHPVPSIEDEVRVVGADPGDEPVVAGPDGTPVVAAPPDDEVVAEGPPAEEPPPSEPPAGKPPVEELPVDLTAVVRAVTEEPSEPPTDEPSEPPTDEPSEPPSAPEGAGLEPPEDGLADGDRAAG